MHSPNSIMSPSSALLIILGLLYLGVALVGSDSTPSQHTSSPPLPPQSMDPPIIGGWVDLDEGEGLNLGVDVEFMPSVDLLVRSVS